MTGLTQQPRTHSQPTPTHPHTTPSIIPHIHHHAKYIERAEAIYAVGLFHLAAKFYFPSTTYRSKQWRTRFLQLRIHPDHYTFSQFLAPNSVYIKLFFNSHDTQRCYRQHGHCYVGSTAIGIPGREHNRRAKLKQLAKNTPISAELSLRYWHATNTITQFSTIHIAIYPDYDQAWIHEPTLNWPYISQRLKLKADGWQFSRHRAHFFPRLANHYRLFRRLRRRLQSTDQPILHTSHKLHALTVLRDLTKHTRAFFDAARHLRSGKYTDLEVYAIRRMATSFEEPGRSRALHLLNQALKYRNLTPPKSNLPLTILAHPNFQSFNAGSPSSSTITNSLPFPSTSPHAEYVKQPTPHYAVACTTTGDGKHC